MEFEQITKRLEWLDEEQRKNKIAISDLIEKLTATETTVNGLAKQLKGLTKEISDLGPAAARLNQFDQIMSKQRTDLSNQVEEMEKRAQRREQEASKLHHTDLAAVNNSVRKLADSINMDDINSRFKDAAHEAQRLTLAIQDMNAKVEDSVQNSNEILVAQRPMEEARRTDSKRMTDLQGEVASIRKRSDDSREKITLHTDGIRNVENRITELLETEVSRKDAQASFLEQQAMNQVERDRAWKDWQEKYEIFKKQADNIEQQAAAFDDTI